MGPFDNNRPMAQSSTAAATYDMGLRAYMLSVYNLMAGGLALTGIVAMLASKSDAFIQLLYRIDSGRVVGIAPLGYVVMFAPLAMVFFLSARINKMTVSGAQMAFWVFAVLMGLSLTNIFLLYTGESIARTFFITAGTFGGMSLYGYTTKRDLTGVGHFLIMGVWGLIIASLVNLFLHSSALQFGISILGLGIFIGLTAYDTQKLKVIYYQVAGNTEAAGRAAIMGALNLYLDFINIFLFLLRFMGNRR